MGEGEACMHVYVRVCINPEEIYSISMSDSIRVYMVLYKIIICSLPYASLWASACMHVCGIADMHMHT